MNRPRGLFLVLGSLAAVACSNSPLYPSNTGTHGGTTVRASDSSGNGSASGGNGNSGSSGGSAGDTTGSTNGKPPGCQSACNLPGQFCDDGGQCVTCLADAQCKDPQPHCYDDAGPYFGTCVECLASDQCPQGQICDSTYLCVPGCVQAQNCAPPAPTCEPDSGMCVSCLSAAECTNGTVCRQGACGACLSSAECFQNYGAAMQICSPEENCVQCEQDLDCEQGQHCVGNHCQ